MMKYLLPILLSVMLGATVNAAGEWKMHPTCGEDITRIIDTPGFTYFTSHPMPFVKGAPYNSTEYLSLFRIDKKTDEVESLSTQNHLSSNTLQALEYSPDFGCLVALDHAGNINLLYDDGSSASIDSYALAEIKGDKTVNSISFDPGHNRIYLSTAFGYIAVNPSKLEIAESRNYGVALDGAARVGGKFIVVSEGKILYTDISSTKLSIDEFSELNTGNRTESVYPLGDIAIFFGGSGSPSRITVMEDDGGELKSLKSYAGRYRNVEYNSAGLFVTTDTDIIQFATDGTTTAIRRPDADHRLPAGSWNLREVWHADRMSGLFSEKPADNPDEWTITRTGILPNAPIVYRVTDMVLSEKYGLLTTNHGTDYSFHHDELGGKLKFAAFSGGTWSNLSPFFTAPGYNETMEAPNGLAVDPVNPDYAYVGSFFSGMKRVNLADGDDVIHLSRKNDKNKNALGFYPLVEDLSGKQSPSPNLGPSWDITCPFSGPKFDNKGNLWISFDDNDNQQPERLHFYLWETSDRLNSTPDNILPPKLVNVPGAIPNSEDFLLPLLHAGNTDMIAYSNRRWDSNLVLIDTNGTPSDASDDRVAVATSFTDRDGIPFEINRIQFLAEDVATGDVWVGHLNGVCRFNPEDMIKGNLKMQRIKVARNDGTNLADYLLDGVRTTGMTTDSQGRKWFATYGAGIVCISTDGRTIENNFTPENSPLPSASVHAVKYIPESNSLMISTSLGMCEYLLPDSKGTSEDSRIRAYPNPVRPDFSGYVTIDRMPENTLVKITDASGNLIKELLADAEGTAVWDVTAMDFRRVSSGVYYIFASPSSENGNFTATGKILVIN